MVAPWASALAGLVALQMHGVGMGPVAAQSAAAVWELDCKPISGEARMGCVARTTLISRGAGGTALRIDVVPAGALGNADAVLRVFLPHGVALNANLGVQIDGGEVYKIPLMTSDRDGVTAIQFIGADVVKKLRNGNALQVTAVTPQGDTAANSVSLVGLTLALDSASRLMEP
ncbi:invasion associated locus B family protein [Tabrizicola sp.]|uniref:invasion associated locus B family protein n=1 Tax=Tabrizicola sp. TaxID=2005166 RepID=UPI0026183003|nr:invasion associated locus B family protein [Tabrizicola sp.]MDM7930878.1 invasion associated locus B family protein [Tabrizicola sp.]